MLSIYLKFIQNAIDITETLVAIWSFHFFKKSQAKYSLHKQLRFPVFVCKICYNFAEYFEILCNFSWNTIITRYLCFI